MNYEQMIEKHEALQLDMLGTIERLQAELDAIKNK